MNAQIDDNGILFIERQGKPKKQECPFQSYRLGPVGPLYCWDGCPLFEEVPSDGETLLVLHCGGDSVIHTIVSDERK